MAEPAGKQDPEKGAASEFARLIAEERQHVQAQVEAARRGEVEQVAESEARHEAKQVATARGLRHYEELLDAALAHLRLHDLLDELLERVRAALDGDTAAVLLLEPDGKHVRAVAAKGIEEEVEQRVRIPVGVGFAGRIVSTGRPIVLREVSPRTVFNPILIQKGIKTLLGVQLVVEGRVTGVLHVGCKRERDFTEQDVKLLQLVADRFAVSIERARLYEEEREHRARAEEASRFKSDLLRMATHDLKTPLTAMQLQLDMLRATRGTPQQQAQALDVVTRNVRRLGLLLDDLLDLSRVESGRIALRMEVVGVSGVAREACETFAEHAKLAGLSLRFEDAEGLTVKGDRQRLAQVLANLLSNALRFTPRGGTVSVQAGRVGDSAVVRVKDTGIGFSEEQRRRLFHPFSQVHGTLEEKQGTGLGLYLSRAIAEAHGGTLTAESPGPGRGAVFALTLPAARA